MNYFISLFNIQLDKLQEFIYHQIEVDDQSHIDMISHFTGCIDFIEGAVAKNGIVFVHWYVFSFLIDFLFIIYCF